MSKKFSLVTYFCNLIISFIFFAIAFTTVISKANNLSQVEQAELILDDALASIRPDDFILNAENNVFEIQSMKPIRRGLNGRRLTKEIHDIIFAKKVWKAPSGRFYDFRPFTVSSDLVKQLIAQHMIENIGQMLGQSQPSEGCSGLLGDEYGL